MKLEWEYQEGVLLPTDSAYPTRLQLVADCCAVAEAITVKCGLHVLLTDDAYIREINRVHRGIDRETDVLSFPTVHYPHGQTAHDAQRLLRKEYTPDADACFLGDILISVPRAQAQATAFGHSLSRELGYLLAHGIFHLFGYDHVTAQQQKEMRQMEEKALGIAGITREGSAPTSPTDEQLLALAREAMQRSYSPYSRFRVGACVLSADGRLFTGCNIENASYGLTNCAERTAIFKAVSEGATDFTAIAIAAENAAPWPCGACRQVLNEFSNDMRVLVTWGHDAVEKTTLAALLPHSFGPKDLP